MKLIQLYDRGIKIYFSQLPISDQLHHFVIIVKIKTKMNSSPAAIALAQSRQKSKQDMKEKNRLYDRSLSGSFAGGLGGSLGSQHSPREGSLNSSFRSSHSTRNNGACQLPNQRTSGRSSKDLDYYIQQQKTPGQDEH